MSSISLRMPKAQLKTIVSALDTIPGIRIQLQRQEAPVSVYDRAMKSDPMTLIGLAILPTRPIAPPTVEAIQEVFVSYLKGKRTMLVVATPRGAQLTYSGPLHDRGDLTELTDEISKQLLPKRKSSSYPPKG